MKLQDIWSERMHPGGKWSGRIGRGKQIRFTALELGANVSLMLFNAFDLTEHFNMPDTLKAQHTSHLTHGNVLMSDNGRVLASIILDDLGWHDPLGGYTLRSMTEAKYGVSRYQEQRNDRFCSGQDNLATELVRNGLGVRDLSPVVNLFSKVFCDEEGNLHFESGHCTAGASVTLRTEMDVLLLVSNTPNPLDTSAAYPSVPVKIEVLPAVPIDDHDECVNYCPENRRAFENTWDYYKLQG